ncbi:hypothetical protein EST38_g10980 [Candolleomyces aberdarensis]|uniref:CCHC-type domain-containing protein n=1 Tax=Candolleomyces aberdarensis TaxID=2316362 RepID=A0A4Q2D8U1_9AGAR|nr:hypothetical protein EST38_g10980 [Candolleomyces aberdarensis]
MRHQIHTEFQTLISPQIGNPANGVARSPSTVKAKVLSELLNGSKVALPIIIRHPHRILPEANDIGSAISCQVDNIPGMFVSSPPSSIVSKVADDDFRGLEGPISISNSHVNACIPEPYDISPAVAGDVVVVRIAPTLARLGPRRRLPSRDALGRFVPEVQVAESDVETLSEGTYSPFSFSPSPATSSFILTPAIWTPNPSPPPESQNLPPPYSPPRQPTPPTSTHENETAQQATNEDKDFDLTMSDIKPFSGDNPDENPQDFIRSLKRMFIARTSFSDATKVDYFQSSLKANTSADTWWIDLPESNKVTWEAVEKAFQEKWPVKRVTPKTPSEKKALLEETKLEEKDLGKKVVVAGVEEYSHIVWADKVEKLAKEIPDTGNLLVDSTREKLPKAIKKLVGTKDMTWAEFCKAVRGLRYTEIMERVEEERDTARLQQQIKTLLDNTPATPSKALGTALRNISLSSAPIPQPQFTAQAFRAPVKTATQQQGYPPSRSDEERMADVRANALPIQPDTPAGRAQYATQKATWERLYPGKKPNEYRPYPLTPGSAPAASGECWTCGQPNHRPTSCQRPAVPEQELIWRRIAGVIEARLRRAGATSVNLVNTVQSDEAGGSRVEEIITREDYETVVRENQMLWGLLNQGKAEGSST